MYGNLASIRETVDLAAAEVLDIALTFLISHGYRTTERTETSLTVTRDESGHANNGEQPHLTVLALPQPEGGVQVTVRGTDRDGVQERQTEWTQWANSLPKRAPSQNATEQMKTREQATSLPASPPPGRPAVAPEKMVDVPKTETASTQIIFDRPDQLEKIRSGLLPGEEIEAVFDLKGGGTGFVGITSKRIIFQDNAWITNTRAVVSIPYSRIHTVAAEDAVGLFTGRGFFSSSTIVITTSAAPRVFQFRGADKAHIAHDLILKHMI
jgi:hypothetical protein